jgi:hypothetical protein
MNIIRRGPDGDPREVELTLEEALVKEIHDALMDRGLDQGTALIHMTGADLPEGLQPDQPLLREVLSDTDFRLYLIR